MHSFLVLSPLGIKYERGWQELVWNISDKKFKNYEISHSVPDIKGFRLEDSNRGDHAVLAVLLHAMQQRSDIIIEGKVSPKLLEGLERLQAIWNRWRPERYHLITIKPEEESELELGHDRPAIFAFSGGVDASFSLFRHLRRHSGRNTRKPGGALLIHGMDIPLEQEDFFIRAAERAERMLVDTNVPLFRMRTNTRLIGQNWEDSFGLQLCACFLVLQRFFSVAVKGSEEPYDSLIFPWGSTPLTDQLCSSFAMKIEHDGCGFDRTEKVQWLCRNTEITHDIRVCWEGSILYENCGKCEKCVRTMLNFWATKQTVPICFPEKLTSELIKTITLRKKIHFLEYRSIYRHASEYYSENNSNMRAVQCIILRYLFMDFKRKLRQLFNLITKRIKTF